MYEGEAERSEYVEGREECEGGRSYSVGSVYVRGSISMSCRSSKGAVGAV